MHFAEQRSITLAQASLMYSYYFSHGIILGTKEICHLQEAADAIAYFYRYKMHEDEQAFEYLTSDA